jgi:hypothetical protein
MANRLMAVAGWLVASAGQGTGWIVEVDGLLGLGRPSTTVTVLARFSPSEFAFASARLDLEVNWPDTIEWSDMEVLLDGPVGDPGTAGPEGVTGIVLGQLHFPPAVMADPSNPIAVWRGTATLLEPGFMICARTNTAEFNVYPSEASPVMAPRTATEGSDRLRVPAPDPAFCYADCDRSGGLDFFDFLCFQNEFATGSNRADCNADCFVDFFDFLCFQDEFGLGCR